MAEIHHSAQNQPERTVSPTAWDLPRWAALPLLVLLLIGFYWKLWSGQYSWLTGDDIHKQVLPWLQFQAGEWHAGRFPAWDPNLWLGQPLAGQAQPGAVYPLNWLLFLSPLRHGWLKEFWLNVYFISIQLMAGCFAYLLARSLARSRLAAILCGLVYSLSGWMGTTDWPQMRNGAVWAPLVVLFLLKICRGERVLRSAAYGGFFLGMAWLSGHHQQPIFLSLLAGGLLAYALFRRVAPPRHILAAGSAFFAISMLIGAAQILPAQEYGKLAIRWVGAPEPAGWDVKVPFEVHKQFSFYPDSLLGILFPHMSVHSTANVGAAVLLLMLLGVVVCWRFREVRLLTAVGAGSIVYSLAHLATFEGWIYAIAPMVDKARSPSMAVSLFGLAAAALAAFGLDALKETSSSDWAARLARVGFWIGIAVYGFRVFSVVAYKDVPPGRQEVMFTAFAALLTAALLSAVPRGAVSVRAAAVCLIGLFIAEIGNTNSVYLPATIDETRMRPLRRMGDFGDIADFLRRQPGQVRVAVDDQAVPFNFGDWHGLSQTGGYLASITVNLNKQEIHAPHMMRLLGIGYALRNQPDPFHDTEVFSGRSGVKVYKSSTAVLPRSFIVHEAVSLSDRRSAPRLAYELRGELHRKTFVLGQPPRLQACSSEDRALITGYDPGRVEVAAMLGCRGMLILSDTWFPGWEARVDGQPARIWEAYGFVRGVVVEAGAHKVEFVYRPVTLIAGSVASILTAIGVACLAALGLYGAWRVRRSPSRL